MSRLFSLFIHTACYPFPHLFPHRRQQLMNLLEEFVEEGGTELCCAEILTLWSEEYGFTGLLLGNVALFLLGLGLMVALDIILHRYGCTNLRLGSGIVSSLYCLVKFRTPQPQTMILIALFVFYWIIGGFWWSIAFLFLVYFTNMGALSAQRR